MAADLFAWASRGLRRLALVLEVTGAHSFLVPVLYEVDKTSLAEFDRSYYWLPFHGPAWPRWSLGWNRSATPTPPGGIAAVLLVYGFMRPRRPAGGWSSAVTGVLVLLLTWLTQCLRCRGSGAPCRWLFCPAGGCKPWWRPHRCDALWPTMLGVALSLRVVWWVQADPGLMGRGMMWPDFLSLWPQSPVFGVGRGRDNRSVQAGDATALGIPWAQPLHRHPGAVWDCGAGADRPSSGCGGRARVRSAAPWPRGPLAMLMAARHHDRGEIVFDWRTRWCRPRSSS